MCNQDNGLIVSTNQASLISQINSFLGSRLDRRVGGGAQWRRSQALGIGFAGDLNEFGTTHFQANLKTFNYKTTLLMVSYLVMFELVSRSVSWLVSSVVGYSVG